MSKQCEQVMKKYFLPVLFILLLIFPADASAGSKTKAQVLSYLASLPSKSSKKVLSGQFIGWCGWEDATLFDDIHAASGQYPGLMSGNYAMFDYPGPSTGDCVDSADLIANTNTFLKKHWAAGGLVEIAWHANNPLNNAWDQSPVSLVNIVTNGTTENTNWKAMMDNVAAALQDLKNNNVVVLWRPFLEMNGYPGGGFWWNGEDGTQFKNLWIYTYNYLTTTKGLTNLIWVFATHADGRTPSTWYPGSSYVDIVGSDIYPADGRFPQPAWYSHYSTYGKPFAYSELGQCYWDGGGCGGKDASYIIKDIRNNAPNTIYWNNWEGVWALDQNNNLRTLMNDPWVINRDDKPSGTEVVPVVSGQSKKPSTPAMLSIQ